MAQQGFTQPPPFATNAKTEEPKKEETQEMTEQNVTQDAPQTQAAPKADKEKKERSAPMKPEHVKYVRENVKNMGYNEMAEALGVSKFQVNRVLQSLKMGMRNKAIEKDGDQAYGKKDDGKSDWSNPLSEMAKKVEAKIENELSRPADTRPGAGRKGGGKVQASIDSELDDLLGDL